MTCKDTAARRTYMRTYQREWMAKRRDGFFRDKQCVHCGAQENLELDHIDPLLKTHHAIWSWAEPRREAELAKCQVLCNSCHKVKTREQLPLTHGFAAFVHGTRTMYNAHGCRCIKCSTVQNDYLRRYRAKVRAS